MTKMENLNELDRRNACLHFALNHYRGCAASHQVGFEPELPRQHSFAVEPSVVIDCAKVFYAWLFQKEEADRKVVDLKIAGANST